MTGDNKEFIFRVTIHLMIVQVDKRKDTKGFLLNTLKSQINDFL
jgi:hypothetical protein